MTKAISGTSGKNSMVKKGGKVTATASSTQIPGKRQLRTKPEFDALVKEPKAVVAKVSKKKSLLDKVAAIVAKDEKAELETAVVETPAAVIVDATNEPHVTNTETVSDGVEVTSSTETNMSLAGFDSFDYCIFDTFDMRVTAKQRLHSEELTNKQVSVRFFEIPNGVAFRSHPMQITFQRCFYLKTGKSTALCLSKQAGDKSNLKTVFGKNDIVYPVSIEYTITPLVSAEPKSKDKASKAKVKAKSKK